MLNNQKGYKIAIIDLIVTYAQITHNKNSRERDSPHIAEKYSFSPPFRAKVHEALQANTQKMQSLEEVLIFIQL